MHADGSGMHQVAEIPAPYPAVELAWSPSGQQLAFTRWGWGEGGSVLYLMDANGAHQHTIDSSRYGLPGTNPAWSPDGKKIAFTYDRGTPQVALINPNGHGLVQLTKGHAYSFDPTWSPDGREIAFVREPAVHSLTSTLMAGSEIYVMSADGSNVRQLTHDQVGEASPAWQPTA